MPHWQEETLVRRENQSGQDLRLSLSKSLIKKVDKKSIALKYRHEEDYTRMRLSFFLFPARGQANTTTIFRPTPVRSHGQNPRVDLGINYDIEDEVLVVLNSKPSKSPDKNYPELVRSFELFERRENPRTSFYS